MPRGPFASIAGLTVLLAVWSQMPAAQRNPVAADPAAIRAGEARFQRSCASCHSVEGRAPALTTGIFTHGGQDAEIFQTIRRGVPATQMPPFAALTDDEIWQLVAYIRSISGGAPPERGAEPRATGDASAGEAIFNGKGGCVSCHEVNGRGGIVGPDLSAAGTRPA